MPTCRDMSELATDYMERAVPPRLRVAMGWHLFRCEACRRYYDQLRRTVLLLADGPPLPPDGAAEESVVLAARRQQDRDS
ncbi:MAG: zf-HC2 domain-containing protein [Acetobacteraceae bacterium]